MIDRNLIERATMAYHRHCSRNGLIFNQPNMGLSEVNDDMIVLRNCNGILAKYWITDKGLRCVEDIHTEDQTHV